MKTRPIQPEDLPSIQLCPKPGWDMKKVKAAGYKTQGKAYLGDVECISNEKYPNKTKSNCPPGWNGKYGNVTYKQLGVISWPEPAL